MPVVGFSPSNVPSLLEPTPQRQYCFFLHRSDTNTRHVAIESMDWCSVVPLSVARLRHVSAVLRADAPAWMCRLQANFLVTTALSETLIPSSRLPGNPKEHSSQRLLHLRMPLRQSSEALGRADRRPRPCRTGSFPLWRSASQVSSASSTSIRKLKGCWRHF